MVLWKLDQVLAFLDAERKLRACSFTSQQLSKMLGIGANTLRLFANFEDFPKPIMFGKKIQRWHISQLHDISVFINKHMINKAHFCTSRKIAQLLGITSYKFGKIMRDNDFPKPYIYGKKIQQWEICELLDYFNMRQPQFSRYYDALNDYIKSIEGNKEL
jgi:predicted DNA-binding transcriptional regulator AlpA